MIIFLIIFERSAGELLSVLGLGGESDFDKSIKVFVVTVCTVKSRRRSMCSVVRAEYQQTRMRKRL